MTITDRDIRAQVEQTLPGEEPLRAGIDVDAIVRDIIQTYGLVDIETIDHDDYWAIVQRHDSTQA